jgi:hypothetical protein
MKIFLLIYMAVRVAASDADIDLEGSDGNIKARTDRLKNIHELLVRKMNGENVDDDIRIILRTKIPGVKSIFMDTVDSDEKIRTALLKLSLGSTKKFNAISNKITDQNKRLEKLIKSLNDNDVEYEKTNEKISERINTKTEDLKTVKDKYKTYEEDKDDLVTGFEKVIEDYEHLAVKVESYEARNKDIKERIAALQNPHANDETLKPIMKILGDFTAEVNQKIQKWMDFGAAHTDKRFDFAAGELFTKAEKWSNTIKLVGMEDSGSPPPKGLINVNSGGTWGRICDDEFSQTDANVVCRTMGFHHSKKHAPHDSDASWFEIFDEYIHITPFVMDETACVGNETSILDCPHQTDNDCGPGESVVIWCVN